MSARVKLRWKPLRATEWRAIPAKKRSVFARSKGVKNSPVRGADIAGHYYLDIYENQKRSYEFLDLHTEGDAQKNDETERLAREVAHHWRDENWRIKHGFGSKLKGAIPFVDWFRSLASDRHKTWNAVLLILEAYPDSEISLSSVDTRWLQAFQKHLLTLVSQNTASTYYAKVKAALQIALEQELIGENPASRVRAIKPQQAQRTYLTKEELQALANTGCVDAETKRAFLFSCYTGLRISDVRRLTWGEYRNGRIEFQQKKTGQPEYLDLPPIAERLMKGAGAHTRPMPDERVFALPRDGTLWTYLQIWGRTAGLTKHLSFHVARHTFATLMLESTKDLYLVSKLLGHTDIKHTQVYAKIVDDRKRAAMMSLPEITLE